MRFFLSYRREDEVAADLAPRLKQSLTNAGHVVFFDLQSTFAGHDFEGKLFRAIDQCDVVLLLIGEAWADSFAQRAGTVDYVEKEIRYSLEKPKLPVIPICIDATEFPDTNEVPPTIHAVTKRDGLRFQRSEFDRSFENLMNQIPTFSLLDDRDFGMEKGGCNLNYFSALVAPFRHERWFAHLAWVFLVAIVPFFNVLALRGWRVDYLARVAQNSRFPFPSARDLPRHIVRGMILWLMTALYWLPLLLLLIAWDATALVALVHGVIELIQGIATLQLDVAGFAISAIGSAIVRSFVPVFFCLVIGFLTTGPLYRAAVIRFALTNRIGSFFEVRTNIRVMFSNYRRFIVVNFVDQINAVLVAFPIYILFGSTIILAGLAPLLHYSITANLYGQLAKAVLFDLENFGTKDEKRSPISGPPTLPESANTDTSDITQKNTLERAPVESPSQSKQPGNTSPPPLPNDRA